MSTRLAAEEYVDRIRARDRAALGRAITLIESRLPADQALAQEILQGLLEEKRSAFRIGISGVPGVGKSTFIERFGLNLTDAGHRVAVLAVDPSSHLTRGSILGDKTRMAALATDDNAFIRPSPSGGTLGGVAQKTRETMLLCEAAGFDVVLVETVGVGQSEAAVADMVDFFLLLLLPGAGDELQGIKRGVLEVADLVVINKADGDHQNAARLAQTAHQNALHLVQRPGPWQPKVLLASAVENRGLKEVWSEIEQHKQVMSEAGALVTKRQQQQVQWMWQLIEEGLLAAFRSHPEVHTLVESIENDVRQGKLTPALAMERLLRAFGA